MGDLKMEIVSLLYRNKQMGESNKTTQEIGVEKEEFL